jgi:hypothetical protein
MMFISLPEITRWGNLSSRHVCPSPIFQRLVQCEVPITPRFLVRPRLLTRFSSLPMRRHLSAQIRLTGRNTFFKTLVLAQALSKSSDLLICMECNSEDLGRRGVQVRGRVAQASCPARGGCHQRDGCCWRISFKF